MVVYHAILLFTIQMFSFAIGITLQTADPDHPTITAHLYVLACTCDMVTKAPIMNMVQFNGYYGCPRCKQKGK